MTEPQTMAACPRWDAKQEQCKTCLHAVKHRNFDGSCEDSGDYCPACTPLAAPATQPPRLSARERILREEREDQEYFAKVPSIKPVVFSVRSTYLAAAGRVIAACDAECDALQGVVDREIELKRTACNNAENFRLALLKSQTEVARLNVSLDCILVEASEQKIRAEKAETENATLRATVERLQHEADRTVSEEIEKNEALESALARAQQHHAPADPQERYRERLDAMVAGFVARHMAILALTEEDMDWFAKRAAMQLARIDAHIAARAGKASD